MKIMYIAYTFCINRKCAEGIRFRVAVFHIAAPLRGSVGRLPGKPGCRLTKGQ